MNVRGIMFVVGRRLVAGSALVLLASLIIGAQVARAGDATTTWSQVTGQPAFSGVTLEDVACPSATHCVAVGYSGNNEVILAGDNGTWTSQNPPQPSQNFGSLNSVSCIDAGNCVAVGYYTTGGNGFNTYHTLVEAWDGANWSIVSSPNVGDTYNFLFSVDCTGGASNQCSAVGYHSNTFGNDRSPHTFVIQGTQTNGTWTFNTTTSPDPGSSNGLQAVRCPTATTCIAIGHADNGGLALQGTQSGGTWSWSTLGTDSTGAGLAGLDCTSATSCIAVGTQGFPAHTLVETWNGSGAFTPISSPNPGGFGSAFSDISCVSASNCSAVGNTTADNASPSVPLVEQWDGANWWQVTAPSSGNGSAALNGVACVPSSNSCVGVGLDNGNALVDTGPGYTPPPNHTLTVTRTGSGSDRVSDGAGAISCPTTCSHAYPESSVVTLTATPGSGSAFAGWSGGGCSGTGTCQVTLNSDTTVNAAFRATAAGSPPTVTTSEPKPAGSTKASFAGLANPNGLPTSVRFQYGLDRRYRAPGYAAASSTSRRRRTRSARVARRPR